MVLIDSGYHQLRSFEQPAMESGLWYLVSFVELADNAAKRQVLRSYQYKRPFPVLLDLQKRLLIYHYGKPKSKPVVCNLELNGAISTPHLYSGALLTGTYNRQGDMFSMALRDVHGVDFTVFLEFQKKPQAVNKSKQRQRKTTSNKKHHRQTVQQNNSGAGAPGEAGDLVLTFPEVRKSGGLFSSPAAHPAFFSY
ncbi:MAG: hypothetical protein U1O81_07900 [Planktothrix rubescens PR223]